MKPSMALARILWTLEPNVIGVNLSNPAFAPQPNLSLHADANIGHRCALTNVGALRLRLRRR